MSSKSSYIEHSVQIKVRFSEVDSLKIVWHGNYLKYFEDAREALGASSGLTYLEIFDSGYVTPIVSSSIQHKSPLFYGSEAIVRIRLMDCRAAKIIHEYEVVDSVSKKVVATGETVQVFLDNEGILQLTVPEFYEEWKSNQKWSDPA